MQSDNKGRSPHGEWQLQEAKNRLSQVVDSALHDGPQTITLSGKPAAVVVAFDDYKKLTLGELQKGISKLAEGNRRAALQAWVEHDLVERFSGRILELDLETALIWGRLQGEAEQKGEKLPAIEALIVATAQARGLSVVTRNGQDIARCGVKICNPWTV